MIKHNTSKVFNIVVIVAALGYFVDIYDLILFGIVRKPSLQAIGITSDELLASNGIFLLNCQMAGMMLGGIVWGVLGDKKGRMSALFLTILLYSLANIANGFVTNINQYAWLRVIAGFGLAGELGVGITLVSEVMSKETRAWGTSIVAGVGVTGAVVAYFVSELGWKEAYITGGVLGLMLLALRIYVSESGMFHKLKASSEKRGNFFSLFTSKKKFKKYILCILVGVPVWYAIGLLVIPSDRLATSLGISGVSPGKTIMYHYVGAAIGSVLIGWLSHHLKSRKKALVFFISCMAILCGIIFMLNGVSSSVFYFLIFVLGLAMGYWGMFVTVASEQFGTNIRSTVTTTVPNFVRGTTVGMTIWLTYMSKDLGFGLINSVVMIGLVVITLAIIAVLSMKETYDKDLDYYEEN